ncbi:MAG: hypothetical protein V4665_01960 [Patescibacteria group bacterium]
MINDELIAYIQAQIRKNISNDIIRGRLQGAGWRTEDIDEAFRKIMPPPPLSPVTPPAPVLPATSPIAPSSTDSRSSVSPLASVEKSDPYREKPVTTPDVSAKPSSAEGPKVWTPSLVKPVDIEKDKDVFPPTQQPVLSASPIQPSVAASLPATPLAPIQNANPVIGEEPKSPISAASSSELDSVIIHEDLTSDFSLKPSPENSVAPVLPLSSQTAPVMSQGISSSPGLAQNALLSSYAQDMNNAAVIAEYPTHPKRRVWKFLIILLICACVVGAGVFAYREGYINISSFIRKDPTELLLQKSAAFEAYASYKTHTSAVVSFPVFSSITTGLTSGETVTSNEMDSVSIETNGSVARTGAGTSFEYSGVVASSLYPDDIPISARSDGSMFFVTIPDLAPMLGKNAPGQSTVSLSSEQVPALVAELPAAIGEKIKYVDLYKALSAFDILSSDISSSEAFKGLVSTMTVGERGTETVNGALSYRYELSADRAAFKAFLSDVVDSFTYDMTEAERAALDRSIGSAALDHFEVWVSKDTNALVGYRIALSLPLSQVIGLEDSGIAGSRVSFDWKTAYSDFNIPVIISTPIDAMGPTEYIKRIHDMKIEDAVSSFPQAAFGLRNVIGTFGKSSNPTGSCTASASGSLFSPLGHTPKAASHVATIAATMNTLLASTEGRGSCYSTPAAWAFSFPLATNEALFYCADSAGALLTTQNPLNGTVCK